MTQELNSGQEFQNLSKESYHVSFLNIKVNIIIRREGEKILEYLCEDSGSNMWRPSEI